MSKISAIIEARMTSTRLPGKHMLLANGKPMIGYLIDRLKQVPSLDEIIMATTINNTDEPLVDLAKTNGISYFRGSENNVMSRVIGAAESVNSEIIVGITMDLDFNEEINDPIKICCKSLPITIAIIIGINCLPIPTISRIFTNGFKTIIKIDVDVVNVKIIAVEVICLNNGNCFSAIAFPKNRFIPTPISKLDNTPNTIEKEPMAAMTPMTSEFV